MTFTPGARLGPYEIVAPIGEGGMGEVYRARDTRLDRTVAVKVLRAQMSDRADLRQRFEREARAVSSLNHPHICTLYDVGQQDGLDFLVMEHLEGETLAARLANGPLPPDQVMRCAIEITDALDHAHRHGVTHRDLKPANIMLTRSGVKVLDFGLAKIGALEPDFLGGRTESAGLTGEGAILGTLQYMAPEQLEGKKVDARTDIFAFGAVLHEMATGQKAFSGDSRASLIAAILTSGPTAASGGTAAAKSLPLERVIRICLAKDPDDRWQTAHDLKLQLEGLAESVPAAQPVAVPVARRTLVPWVLAGVLLPVAVGLGIAYWQKAPPPAAEVRLAVSPPDKTRFLDSIALSPDGRRVAFVAVDAAGKTRLWVRPLDSLEAQPVASEEGTRFFFWSPDGRFLAANSQGKLKKLPVAGGPPETLADALAAGGAWNRQGVILFSFYGGPLLRLPAAGGQPASLTALDASRQENSHLFPQFLPDGRRFLYLAATRNYQNNQIQLGALDGRDVKSVLPAESFVGYCEPGYIVFVRGRALLAQRFDAGKGEVTGEPLTLAQDVGYVPADTRAIASVSENGVLAYQTAGARLMQLTWLDRSGRQVGVAGKPDHYSSFRLSPDSRRVAVTRQDPQSGGFDVWMLDLARGISSRFTVEPSSEFQPVWSPDGTRVAYYSDVNGVFDLFQKSLTGGDAPRAVLLSGADKNTNDWSSDGRFLVYRQSSAQTRGDLWLAPLQGEGKPRPYLQSEFDELDGVISPDGRWMAYTSNETGRNEVYIQSFPTPGGKLQISTNGGGLARWRRDGKELFYVSEARDLMAIDVTAGGSGVEAGTPRKLFELRPGFLPMEATFYDVASDGTRFLVAAVAEETPASLIVVLNWTSRLTR